MAVRFELQGVHSEKSERLAERCVLFLHTQVTFILEGIPHILGKLACMPARCMRVCVCVCVFVPACVRYTLGYGDHDYPHPVKLS